MAYTSEIDKLEARFRDNPKGRNFAPLADAYRKAGLIDNAIDLCQNGLKLHPDYVSAYIVYARCLVDKKDDAAALGVFKKVLELDGENIIALRGLAELAERNGKYEEEVEWLSRLLNADPMNGDAAEALARAKAKAAAPTAAMDKPVFAIEHEEKVETTLKVRPSASGAAPSPDVENLENPISFNPSAHAAARAEGLEVQEDVELNAQQIEQVEIEGLARTQYEGSGMFKLDAPEPTGADGRASELDESLPQVDLPLIMPDDEMKRAAPTPPPRARAVVDDDGAADTATLSQAEPVLTETMAELYLKQGHQQDALRVYQALLAQRPNDPKLKSRIEQLSHGGKKGSGVSAQAFLKGIWSGRGASPPPPAPAPFEQSTLAAAFDVADPTPGEPSHPAHDHISLDSVFGEEAARRSNPTGAPQSPASAAPEAGKTGGFSFDEFFAGAKEGGAASGPAADAAANAPASGAGGAGGGGGGGGSGGGGGPRSSGRTQRPPEDEVEADQFQQWLKKLKS